MSNQNLRYSPVCDVCPVAYVAYLCATGKVSLADLDSLTRVEDGSSVKRVGWEFRDVGYGEDNRRRDDSGGCIGVISSGLDGVERDKDLALGCSGHHACSGGVGSGGVIAADYSCEGRVAGMASCDADNGSSNLGGVSAEGSDVPAVSAGSEEPLVNSGRGKNYERNRISREKKKKQKENRRQRGQSFRSVPEWRRKSPVEEKGLPMWDDSYRKGYFAECPKEVQDSLRESRAAMLVAKNKRDQAEYEKRAKQLSSTEEAVRTVLSALRLSEQLKSIKDAKVGGWVETIADTMVKSVAESVPDSVPSLESVGYGKSALKSSSGSESGASLERNIEYNIRKRDLDDCYESLEAYNPNDYKDDLTALRLKFSDVTGEEKPQLSAADITRAAIVAGMDYHGITAMLKDLGMDS